jgi:hypothetical protein
MHVLSDPNDPFFTSLQGEKYVNPCPGPKCHTPTKPGTTKPGSASDSGSTGLLKKTKVAIAVVVTVVGVMLLLLLTWCIFRHRSKKAKALAK